MSWAPGPWPIWKVTCSPFPGDEAEALFIHMRFVDELTHAHIGERLGVSQMHVSRLLTRCLARLREGMLTTS